MKDFFDAGTGMLILSTPSRTRPGVEHQQFVRIQCTCEGFSHRGECAHTKKIIAAAKRAMKGLDK